MSAACAIPPPKPELRASTQLFQQVQAYLDSPEALGHTAATRQGLAMAPIMSSVIRYSSKSDDGEGDILLHSGVGPTKREDVRGWRSDDEGTSWQRETVLASGFAQYSVLTRLDDGTLDRPPSPRQPGQRR